MKFNKDVRSVKWEFGYWGKTLKNWYSQGLEEKNYPRIPTDISTFQASLYTTAWINKWKKQGAKESEKIELPNGIGVWGGGTYWPNQGFPLDNDVANFFNFDRSTILVKIEQLLYPKFDIKILDEDEEKLTYIDLDGVERVYLK
ncbi:MAG: hypothetical protein ACQEP2_06385, partial [Actinomycetota bacterium]